MEIDEITLELPTDKHLSVEDVLVIITNEYQAFKDYVDQGQRVMIAVNQSITEPNHQLISGDELALFPPVTGG